MADLLDAAFGTQAPANTSPDLLNAAFGNAPDATAAPSTPTTQPAGAPLSAGERFETGLGDAAYGLGQLAEHTPGLSTVIHGWQDIGQVASEGLAKGFNAMGMKGAADAATDAALSFEPDTAQQFDQIVQQRNASYENARAAAGQTGIDWWRLGGEAANPINYLSGGAGAAESIGGRLLQAGVTGALVNSSQPVDNSGVPGGFWWDKSKQAMSGFVSGGVAGGLVETIAPTLRAATAIVRNRFGTATPSGAAEQVVNEAMSQHGLDPNTVPAPLLTSMRNEVSDALKQGADPSPIAITNRLKAESLPVPVQLMRGQASGDSMAFARELNLRGIQGVGEPITTRLQQQNAAFIGNLDALGAKDAPDVVSTGQYINDKLNGHWNQLETNKNMLYSAVRNNKGQSAAVDQFTAAQNIRNTLDTPEASHAYDLLPANIKRTIGDMEDGNIHLTVAKLQLLDHTWGQAAAGDQDGSVRNAIYQARTMLNQAPIQDDVGQQARQAYTAAKAAHAQQMSLINPKLLNGKPNPAYQPLMDAVVNGKPPEKLFNTGILTTTPSQAANNMKFMAQIDPNSTEIMGRTLMGEIKRQALSSASDERGTVSQSVLNGWARDPVKSKLLANVMPPSNVQTFKNLADTVEAAKRFPVGSAVNTSNTGSAVVNAGVNMLKRSAIAQAAKHVPGIAYAAEGMQQAGIQRGVQEALNPGVTLKSLLRGGPKQAMRQHILASAIAPAMALKSNSKSRNPSD